MKGKGFVMVALLAVIVILSAGMILMTVRDGNLPAYDSSRVLDLAGVLSEQETLTLSQSLDTLQRTDQLNGALITVESLEGERIERYANRLYRHWQMDGEATNGGVLIVLAPAEGEGCVVSNGALAKWLAKTGGAMPTQEQCIELINQMGYGQGARTIVDQVAARANGYYYAARAQAAAQEESDPMNWVTPLLVFLGIALVMGAIVWQERIFFFKRKENRGGIARPMYNVGSGSLGGPNIDARGKN